MQALARSVRYAALVIFIAFAMHNLNGALIEPRYLGFGSYADYPDLGKLMNASRGLPPHRSPLPPPRSPRRASG